MKDENLKSITEVENSELKHSGFGLSALSFKLGYDGKRAANNLTGLGNYSRSLIEQLANQFPVHQYFIYTPKVKEKILELPLFSKKNIKIVLPQKGSRLLWRSFGIKKQLLNDEIDIFHGLSHEIPFGIQNTKIKSIVTMHDLIFLRKPEYYQFIDRTIYRLKSEYACKHADRIIAISEQTKKDIIDLYHTNPEKIDVIYQSCDDSFKTLLPHEVKEKTREKYQLPTKYLLYVGTIEARKNLLVLIKALPKVNNDVKLVVIGKETNYTKLVKQEIEKLRLQNRVIFLTGLPFADLPSIYQMANMFILPSYYEGFGIPIIEALYGNVPVIAAKGSCLEEAGGPDSLYFSPDDHHELATKINTVLADKQLQETMKQKGLMYVQRFNSEIVNQQLMDCYLKTQTL